LRIATVTPDPKQKRARQILPGSLFEGLFVRSATAGNHQSSIIQSPIEVSGRIKMELAFIGSNRKWATLPEEPRIWRQQSCLFRHSDW
jgi:hypothetical protein